MVQINLETLQIAGTVLLNSVFPPSIFFIVPSDIVGTGVYSYGLEILNPAHVVNVFANSVSNTFLEIWFWLLYNLLTPFLIIVIVVLFFVMQYYLIKLYIYVFKLTAGKVLKGLELLSETKFFIEVKSLYANLLK